MKKINYSLFVLISITLIGFLFRVWNITNTPPSLNWDEVSHGYNAYSILKTGHDEWGIRFPLIFRAFGDYKLPLYIYLTTPMIAIFGLNTFSVRLVSVLAGTIAIPLIYLLTNELFKNKKENNSYNHGILAMLLLAFLPWHIFLSRAAFEANLALTFIFAGALFLLKSLHNPKYFIPASLLFLFSLHTYNTARVFVPLLLIVWWIIYRQQIKFRSVFWGGTLLLLVSFLPIFMQIRDGTGTARYERLAILSNAAVYQIGQNRLSSPLPPLISKLIYNRPVYFTSHFLQKYLSFFTPDFLFQRSGTNTQFAMPNQNLLGYPVIILTLIGLLILVRNIKNASSQFILAWYFLAPVAASVTIDPPHVLRSLVLIPATIVIATVALKSLLVRFGRYVVYLTVISIVIGTANFFNNYFTKYSIEYSDSWQYGNAQAIQYIKEHANDYNNVVMTKRLGEPHIFYAFYTKAEPSSLWPSDTNIRFKQSDWYWTDRLGSVYFVNDWDIAPNKRMLSIKLESGEMVETRNTLLITSPDHLPSNSTVLERINFLNGHPAYIIASIHD